MSAEGLPASYVALSEVTISSSCPSSQASTRAPNSFQRLEDREVSVKTLSEPALPRHAHAAAQTESASRLARHVDVEVHVETNVTSMRAQEKHKTGISKSETETTETKAKVKTEVFCRRAILEAEGVSRSSVAAPCTPLQPQTQHYLEDPLARSHVPPQAALHTALRRGRSSSSPTDMRSTSMTTATRLASAASSASFADARPSPRGVASTCILAEQPVRRRRLSHRSQTSVEDKDQDCEAPYSPRRQSTCGALSCTERPGAACHGLNENDTLGSIPSQVVLSARTIRLPCAMEEEEVEEKAEACFDVSERTTRIVMAPERVHVTPLTRIYIEPVAEPHATSRQHRATPRAKRLSQSGTVIVLDGAAVLAQVVAKMETCVWKWVLSGCVRLGLLPSTPRGFCWVVRYCGPLPRCLQHACVPLPSSSSTHAPSHRSSLLLKDNDGDSAAAAARARGMGERAVMKRIATFLPSVACDTPTSQENAGHHKSHETSTQEEEEEADLVQAVLRPPLAVALWGLRGLRHPHLAAIIDVHALHGALHEEKRNELCENTTHGTADDDAESSAAETEDSESGLTNGGEVLRYRVSHRLFKHYTPSACRITAVDLLAKEWCLRVGAPASGSTAGSASTHIVFPGGPASQTVFVLARQYVPAPAATLHDYLRTWEAWARPQQTALVAERRTAICQDLHDHDEKTAEKETDTVAATDDAGSDRTPRLFSSHARAGSAQFHTAIANLLWQVTDAVYALHHYSYSCVHGDAEAKDSAESVGRVTKTKGGTPAPPKPNPPTQQVNRSRARRRGFHGNLKPSNVLLHFPSLSTAPSPSSRTPPFHVFLTDFGLPMLSPSLYACDVPPITILTNATSPARDAKDAMRSPAEQTLTYRCLLPSTAPPLFHYGSHAPSHASPHNALKDDVYGGEKEEDEAHVLYSDVLPFIAPERVLLTEAASCLIAQDKTKDTREDSPRSAHAEHTADDSQTSPVPLLSVTDIAQPGRHGASSTDSPFANNSPIPAAMSRLWVCEDGVAEEEMPSSAAAADVYALGVMWFTLLTGETPPRPPYGTLDTTELDENKTTGRRTPRETQVVCEGGSESGRSTPFRNPAAATVAVVRVASRTLLCCSEASRHVYRRGLLEILIVHAFGSSFMTAPLLDIEHDLARLGLTGELAQVARDVLVRRCKPTDDHPVPADTALPSSPHEPTRIGDGDGGSVRGQRGTRSRTSKTRVALPACLFPYQSASAQPDGDVTYQQAHLGPALFVMLRMTERAPHAAALFEAMLGLLDPRPETRWTIGQLQRSAFFTLFGERARRDSRSEVIPRTVPFSADAGFAQMMQGPAFHWHVHPCGGGEEDVNRLPGRGKPCRRWESLSQPSPLFATSPSDQHAPHVSSVLVVLFAIVFVTKLRRRAYFTRMKSYALLRSRGGSKTPLHTLTSPHTALSRVLLASSQPLAAVPLLTRRRASLPESTAAVRGLPEKASVGGTACAARPSSSSSAAAYELPCMNATRTGTTSATATQSRVSKTALTLSRSRPRGPHPHSPHSGSASSSSSSRGGSSSSSGQLTRYGHAPPRSALTSLRDVPQRALRIKVEDASPAPSHRPTKPRLTSASTASVLRRTQPPPPLASSRVMPPTLNAVYDRKTADHTTGKIPFLALPSRGIRSVAGSRGLSPSMSRSSTGACDLSAVGDVGGDSGRLLSHSSPTRSNAMMHTVASSPDVVERPSRKLILRRA